MIRRLRAAAVLRLLILVLLLLVPVSAVADSRPAGVAVGPGVGAEQGVTPPMLRRHGAAPMGLIAPLASGTLGHRLRVYVGRRSTIVLLAVLVVCSLVLMVLRRRATRPRNTGHNRSAGEQ